MSLESRIADLEKGKGSGEDNRITCILVKLHGSPDYREPTNEEVHQLEKEARAKNPDQEIVIVTAIPRPIIQA